MSWCCLTLTLSGPAALEQAETALVSLGVDSWETLDPSETTRYLEENRDYHDYVGTLPEAGPLRLRLYAPGKRELQPVIDWAKTCRIGKEPCVTGMETIQAEADDWQQAYRQYFHTFQVGRLTVRPAWEQTDAPPPVLCIEPGSAFGTGAHATTRMCLQLLESLPLAGQTVLDVGTGSGILAVAAALLGAQSVRGVDIDPSALPVARETAAQNGVGNVQFAAQNGLQGEKGPYQLIIANIVADIILRLAPEAITLLSPQGRFCCSGILCERLCEVASGLERAGLSIQAVLCQEGWAAVLAARQ